MADSAAVREPALTERKWRGFFDPDGRIVNESEVRRCVFRGGIEESLRPEVWRFLFGLYPFNSTAREREVVVTELGLRYNSLKQRWKSLLELYSPNEVREPDYLKSNEQSPVTTSAAVTSMSYTSNSSSDDQQISFLQLQAQVYAGRLNVDIPSMKKAIRIIDKDVPRNDRHLPYFHGKGNPNLRVLRDILITFSAFHPDLGYAQGMNDILSRFLVVLNDEADAYWCFTKHLERIQMDFMEKGMVDKLETVKKLLGEMDKEYLDFFVQSEMDDFMFCHRWLLLSFKREFPFDQGILLFEILSSHHLELCSLEAEKAKRKEQVLEKERMGGDVGTRSEVMVNSDFTFEVFLCLAILHDYRQEIMACSSACQLYEVCNGLSMCMDLNKLLCTAEDLFFKYCRKSVSDCFELISPPQSPQPL